MPVIASPLVKYALIAAVPAASRFNQTHYLRELVISGCKYHDARVKNIRPANIGGSCKLVRQSKQVGQRPYGQDICVKKNDLVELRQAENV